MNNVIIGPSGMSDIFYQQGFQHTKQAPQWLKSVGLSAMEYSFGRGYTMGSETAISIGEQAQQNSVLLSVHAPYYINFANADEQMVEKSFGYVLTGLKFLNYFKGEKLVIHIASQGKVSRGEALYLTKKRLEKCLDLVYQQFEMSNVYICPETMGKYMQIGTYQEIIELCKLDKCLIPTFDFGHINCILQGSLKTSDDYLKIFDYSFEKLGDYKTKNCHIHFSKILFSEKGEVKHLNFEDNEYGPDFLPLAKVIKSLNLTPSIICESKGKMCEDALIMNEIFNSV